MRSTNIVLFLLLLNFSAAIVAGAGIAEIDPTTGQDDVLLTTYNDSIADRNQTQPAQDNIIFGGLNMLVNLGMPAIFATGAKTFIGFIVFIDAVEATTGRRLS